MKETLEQIINRNPLDIVEEHSVSDIIFIKLRLEITVEQILEKYGKFKTKYSEIHKVDLPLTQQELVEKLPKQTKEMLWAINNARKLITDLEDLTRMQDDSLRNLRLQNNILRTKLQVKEKELTKTEHLLEKITPMI